MIIEAIYYVDINRFQYWQMTHPTKNFVISIDYPRDYSVQFKPLVLNENLCQIIKELGQTMIKYDSWALPNSGLAFKYKIKTLFRNRLILEKNIFMFR